MRVCPGPEYRVDADLVVAGAAVDVDRHPVLVSEQPHHLPGLGFEFLHREGPRLDDLQLAPGALPVLEEPEAEFVPAGPLDDEPPVAERRQVAMDRTLCDCQPFGQLGSPRAVKLPEEFGEVERGFVGLDPAAGRVPDRAWGRLGGYTNSAETGRIVPESRRCTRRLVRHRRAVAPFRLRITAVRVLLPYTVPPQRPLATSTGGGSGPTAAGRARNRIRSRNLFDHIE